jgi:PAS domain S-box-containing protein
MTAEVRGGHSHHPLNAGSERCVPSKGTGPITVTTAVLAGKWKSKIVWILRKGPCYYSQLLSYLPEVAHKVVSQQLRELTEDGVIDRQVGIGGPRRVRYGLTDAGRQLIPILELMERWGTQNDKVAQISRSVSEDDDLTNESSSNGAEVLKILLVEDREPDAELVERELSRMQVPYESIRVLGEREFRNALVSFDPDIILTDHSLPTFSAKDVVRIARAEVPETPIIVVTGSLDEETAVEYLKAGASDYILKDRIRRLGPAIQRVLDLQRTQRAHGEAVEEGRRREELLHAIIRAAPVAVFSLDLRGTVLSWNPAAERIFGWTGGETIGRPLPIVTAENEAEHHATIARILEGQTLNGLEVIRRKRDGTPVAIRLYAAPLYDSGRIRGIVAIAGDLSEIKQLENQYHQAQKMEAVGRLAGSVAHDFNNILTVILGESEMAHADIAADHPAKGSVDEIRKAAARAAELTGQLLAFSRRQPAKPAVFQLNDVVNDVERMLQRLIGVDVQMVTRLAPEAGTVRLDRGQFEQVLVNLVVNARDAMPKGGVLTIETDNIGLDETSSHQYPGVQPGEYARLAISDTGTGIPPELITQIFEPFFTTKGQRGTGLGLSTCYGIVKSAGGHISVESTPGAGTTMRVLLPRVPESALATSN